MLNNQRIRVLRPMCFLLYKYYFRASSRKVGTNVGLGDTSALWHSPEIRHPGGHLTVNIQGWGYVVYASKTGSYLTSVCWSVTI